MFRFIKNPMQVVKAPVCCIPKSLEISNRNKGMLIHGIHMIWLMDNKHSQGTEFRDEPTQHPRLVHLSEGVINPRTFHYFKKIMNGLRRTPRPMADSQEVRPDMLF